MTPRNLPVARPRLIFDGNMVEFVPVNNPSFCLDETRQVLLPDHEILADVVIDAEAHRV
jgi:hypothetical protein